MTTKETTMDTVHLTITSAQLATVLEALDRDIEYVSDNWFLTATEAEDAIGKLMTLTRVLYDQANTTDEGA